MVTAGKLCRSVRRTGRTTSGALRLRARGQAIDPELPGKVMSGIVPDVGQQTSPAEVQRFDRCSAIQNRCCGYDTHRHRTSWAENYAWARTLKIRSITEADAVAIRVPTDCSAL
jgi:hypothetical protein